MNIHLSIQVGLREILAHKFRSFLTILGIIVGILTVIVIASILTGMRQSVVSQLEDYGTNNIYAFHLSMMQFGRRSREEMMRKPLTIQDAVFDEALDIIEESLGAAAAAQ